MNTTGPAPITEHLLRRTIEHLYEVGAIHDADLLQAGPLQSIRLTELRFRFAVPLPREWNMVPRVGVYYRGFAADDPEQGMSEDQVLTIKDVATILKLAEKTVYSMAHGGELPAFKVRGQWRIRKLDLDKWMADQIADGAKARLEGGSQ